MSQGLGTTLELLGHTLNEAAVRVLLPALDSPRVAIREGALEAILARRSPAGHRELVSRLHAVDEPSRQIIRRHSSRLTQALRDAILGEECQSFSNACRAAVWFREYDLVPALIHVGEDPSSPRAEPAARTMLELVKLLADELAGPLKGAGLRDREILRRHAVELLERSVEGFAGHHRREIVDAFVLLIKRDNAVLRKVLNDSHHTAFRTLVDVFLKSPSPSVIGLLLGFLHDPRAPVAVLSVVSKRQDLRLVRLLLREIERESSNALVNNLKRVRSIAWLPIADRMLDELEEAGQPAVVKLAMDSGIPRAAAFATVKRVLLHGGAEGRRAASKALEAFNGAEANSLATQALNDEDPQVQANVLMQLRHRGILGALPWLVQKVDSPHAVVREAVRASLDEFSFQRFLAAFDMLDEEVRHSTGTLVKKVDHRTIPQLRAELESPAGTRRLRALAIARIIDAVPPLEETIVRLLRDEDHMVRAGAARALAYGETLASRGALQEALHDRSAAVQEAARRSIRDRIEFRHRRRPDSDQQPPREHTE